VKRGCPEHTGGPSRSAKRSGQDISPSTVDPAFAHCVSWPVAKVASQLQLSVECDRAAVDNAFQDVLVQNDLSGSAIACIDLGAVVKLFDDALTPSGLKTIGLHAAVSFFLACMKSHM